MTHNEPVGQSSSDSERVVSLRAYAKLEKELESVKQEFRGYIEQLQTKVEKNEDKGRWLTDDIVHLENEVEEVRSSTQNSGGSGDESGSIESDNDMLPIERLAQLREQDKEHPALPKNGKESFDRAVAIYENFRKWSKKTPKGRTITDNLKNLLSAVTGENLAWRQVYRAMDAIQKWSRGTITHEQTRRHGHILVMDGQASSAG